jgi:ABC-type antimicrobial peptide transport system permease subunit
MQRRILRTITLVLLLFTMVNLTMAQEEPSEQLKIEALKLGYQLNGNSMVRWGSIDLTSIIHNPYHPYIKPDFIGPPAPPKLEPDK